MGNIVIPPFAQALAARLGFDPRVVAAWQQAEGGPPNNPLNIGPFKHLNDPVNDTAAFLTSQDTHGYYKGIISSRNNPSAQIEAIKSSPWDAGHYSNGSLNRTAAEYGISPSSVWSSTQPSKQALSNYMQKQPNPQAPDANQDYGRQALLKYVMTNSSLMAQGQQSQSIFPTLMDISQHPPGASVSPSQTNAGPKAVQALHTALAQQGVPYKWGGTTPQGGFDCSGLVQYSYAKAGINVPRTSEEQWASGTPIAQGQLKAGDAVFFKGASGAPPGHEAMYIGNGNVIVSPHSGGHVQIVPLNSIGGYMGARRFG